MSRTPGPECHDPLSPLLPPRTPGPLGRSDAADPSARARRGDTPGPLGVNDGAAGLCGPAMPKAKLDDPAMIVVRMRREQYESALRKCHVYLVAAAKHGKAFEDSKTPLRPKGDPALERAAETETKRWCDMAEAHVKPAVQAYTEAIAKAVLGGRAGLSGTFSVGEAMKLLCQLEAGSQSMGWTGGAVDEGDQVLPLNDYASVLDRMAEDVLKWCTFDKSPSRLNIAIMILEVADAVEASQWRYAFSRHDRWTRQQEQDLTNELRQRNPGIRKLREFIDALDV